MLKLRVIMNTFRRSARSAIIPANGVTKKIGAWDTNDTRPSRNGDCVNR